LIWNYNFIYVWFPNAGAVNDVNVKLIARNDRRNYLCPYLL